MKNGTVGKIETGVDGVGLSVDNVENKKKLVFVKPTDKSSDIVVDILGCINSEAHVILDDVEGERI